jgi:hypothetical protein
MLRIAFFLIAVLGSSTHADAQGAPASGSSATTGARTKPTAAEKRCLASRRRVERQNEVIAEADARLAKEQKARASCKTKRACESLDRALKASETRQQRHAKQLAQFESETRKACDALPDAVKAPDYRNSTAVTNNPTTTNPNSTK